MKSSKSDADIVFSNPFIWIPRDKILAKYRSETHAIFISINQISYIRGANISTYRELEGEPCYEIGISIIEKSKEFKSEDFGPITVFVDSDYFESDILPYLYIINHKN